MSARRATAWGLLGLGLIAVVLAVWWRGTPVPAAPAPKTPEPVPEAAAPSEESPPMRAPAPARASVAPVAIAKKTPRPPEPSPLPQHLLLAPELSEVLPELLQMAERGNVVAMTTLGWRLSSCNDNNLRRLRAELKETESEPAETGKDAQQWNERRQNRLENQRNDIAACEALPADARNTGFDWLERAAAAGWGRAQLDYAGLALQEYTQLDKAEFLRQIDEILRRRDLARRFLAEAMTHCVEGALRTNLDALERLFEGNDERALAIGKAAAIDALMREARAQGNPQWAQREQASFDVFLRDQDASAREEARRQGEAIYRICAPQ